jgi:uncharacterized protein (DUF1697 family)
MPKSQRYVVLVRGINVGGHSKLPMARLRGLCAAIGCTEVTTYIQSGNAVLVSSLTAPRLRSGLTRALTDELGRPVEVMVRTPAEMAAVVSDTPYPDAAVTSVHVAFLHKPPGNTAALADLDCAPEELAVVGKEIYLHLPNGLGRARLPVELGKVFKEPMTVRNWRTVTKLVEMSS